MSELQEFIEFTDQGKINRLVATKKKVLVSKKRWMSLCESGVTFGCRGRARCRFIKLAKLYQSYQDWTVANDPSLWTILSPSVKERGEFNQ